MMHSRQMSKQMVERSALSEGDEHADFLTGTSKLPLWDTVKHFASRMNIHMMFGEEVGS